MKVAFVCLECENLGVEYLSACLKKAGHEVSLYFDPMLFGTYYLHLDVLNKLFSYKQRIINNVCSSSAELICFSVLSDYYGWACEVAKEIKERKKDCRILFGGIHPTCVPDRVANETFVDYICVGEGEEALVELVDQLEKGCDGTGIQNIWARKGESFVKSAVRPVLGDLDQLPFPDKELFHQEYPYFQKTYLILSGRGCPHACSYCYSSYYQEFYKGKYLRKRSVDNVIEELVMAKRKYNPRRISFFDDTFIYDIDWLEKFSWKYKKEVNIPYTCFVHPNYVTEKSVALLDQSECHSVIMGIQTSREDIRKKVLRRFEKNEQIIQAVDLIKKTRIFLHGTMMFGLPMQDEDCLVEEVRFASRLRIDLPSANWLRHYPKTKIIEISKQMFSLTDKDEEGIEESKGYHPFGENWKGYIKNGEKLRNLLIMSPFLPISWVEFILDRRLYRIFPAVNAYYLLAVFSRVYGWFVLQRKQPDTYLSLSDVLKYYFFYLFMKKDKKSTPPASHSEGVKDVG